MQKHQSDYNWFDLIVQTIDASGGGRSMFFIFAHSMLMVFAWIGVQTLFGGGWRLDGLNYSVLDGHKKTFLFGNWKNFYIKNIVVTSQCHKTFAFHTINPQEQ